MKRKGFLLMLVFIFALTPLFGADQLVGANDEGTTENTDEPAAVLVSEGQAQATIVLDSEALELEQQAADELQDYIKQISDVELPIVNDDDEADGVTLYIGSAVDEPELDKIREDGDDPASFRLLVTEEAIQLNGLSEEGTLYAAYELLEQLGIRWIMPGDYGTVVPASNTVSVKLQDTIQHPGFATRRLQPLMKDEAEWAQHNRLGGENYGRHGMPCAISNKDRPDLFMKENGEITRQFDVTEPEVLDCVVEGALAELEDDPDLKYISMGPRDGGGFGTSEWDADDDDPMQGGLSHTDRYVKFYNMVIEELEKAGYSDVGVATYIYSRYIRPPVREKPSPKILPVFAPITTERMHSIDNPLSWERQYLKDIYDGWADLGVDMMYRGYLFNLADPGMPFTMIDQIENEFKYYYENGFERMRIETIANWAYHGPSLYLATKMMWDPELDVGALLDDYFTMFYGPAAEPMQEHFDRLEQAFKEADYFAGGINDFPHILTAEVLQELEQTLSEAEAIAEGADDPAYGARIQKTRIGFDYGKHFMEMIDVFHQFDFIQAKEKYDLVNDLAEEARSNNIIDRALNYKDRFFGKMMTQGYERVTDGNEIVVEFPDEWHVMLDPLSGGEELGLWKPTLGTESWMKLKTYSQTWSNQGLRYYKGNAWYRTTIEVPEEFNERDFRLWLSNIDEAAKVWINGQELPLTIQGGSLGNPWEFDATDAINVGEPNVVVVDVTNKVLDELGTGGIMGPVVLWSPSEVETSTDIKTIVERSEDEGELTDDVAHPLKLHLTAVGRFEQTEQSEKVVKHMKGFKQLLNHQKDNELISEDLYNTLNTEADSLIKKWQ